MIKKKQVTKANNKKIKIIFILILLGCILIGGSFLLGRKKESGKIKKEIKVEETIENYGYELRDNATDYYKSLFKELKTVLNSDSEEEKYATLVSQLFLADFFNLDNKISKNDVGGMQFVYSDFQSDFENLAKESVYHYIESNIYGDRKQELPVVKEVSVLNVETDTFTYLEETDKEAYSIDLKITYEEDLGYQENATLVLVHHNDKLEIIKMSE